MYLYMYIQFLLIRVRWQVRISKKEDWHSLSNLHGYPLLLSEHFQQLRYWLNRSHLEILTEIKGQNSLLRK